MVLVGDHIKTRLYMPAPWGAEYLADIIPKAISPAMGIAVAVTSVLGELNVTHGLSMLGIGLACLAIREPKK